MTTPDGYKPVPRRIPSRDAIAMMEAGFVRVSGEYSGGSVFLRLGRIVKGQHLWGSFVELTPEATTRLITDLCKVRNAAQEVDLTKDLLRLGQIRET